MVAVDDERQAPGHGDLAGADERHVAEPQRACSGRRELAREILGRREEDADDVVVRDPVALEHLAHELLRTCLDLLRSIEVAGDGAAHGRDSHGRRR